MKRHPFEGHSDSRFGFDLAHHFAARRPAARGLARSAQSRRATLRRQANDLNSVITSVRGYYANNVVGRVLASPRPDARSSTTTRTCRAPSRSPRRCRSSSARSSASSSGTSPTASSPIIRSRTARRTCSMTSRTARSPRCAPIRTSRFTDVSSTVFTGRVRLVAPVIMGAACVNCHNTHPESPKRDWKVGDVRGIQEVIVTQPIAANIFSFKYLLGYFVVHGGVRRRLHRHAAPPGRDDPRHEQGTRNRQRLPRLAFDEDLALSLAADLQEHFHRREGRHHPDRAQEAHDLLLRHQGFHRDDRAAAAGGDHAAAQRVFHRDVEDRAAAWRHGRQVHRRRRS